MLRMIDGKLTLCNPYLANEEIKVAPSNAILLNVTDLLDSAVSGSQNEQPYKKKVLPINQKALSSSKAFGLVPFNENHESKRRPLAIQITKLLIRVYSL